MGDSSRRVKIDCLVFGLDRFFVDFKAFLNDLENVCKELTFIAPINRVQIFLILSDARDLLTQPGVNSRKILFNLLVVGLASCDVGVPLCVNAGV